MPRPQPIVGPQRRFSRFVIALTAPLHQVLSHACPRRDDVDQTDMVSLVQAGFSRDEVASLFARLSKRCGKVEAQG